VFGAVRTANVDIVKMLVEAEDLLARQEHNCSFVAVTAEGETREERGKKNKEKLLKGARKPQR
jgi:hypothetical protein